jgi:hypothetical protein
MEDFQLEMQDLTQDIVKVNTKGASADIKIELLAAIIAKQHKMMHNMNDSIIDLTRRLMRNEIVILNLKECRQDQLSTAVLYAFNALGFTAEVDYETMYRRGPPRKDTEAAPRPVVVRLFRSSVADMLIKLSREKSTPGDRRSVRILPNIPEQHRQARAKLGTIAFKKKEKDPSAKIEVKQDHVLINKVKIADDVDPATPNEILFLDQKERASIQSCEFVTTRQMPCKGSFFQLYYYKVTSQSQCRLAYKAISTIPAVACKSHLISAYSINDDIIGWQDDHDYGLGKFLLRTMEDREMTNAMCFITREYGGYHIGKKRFEIIQKLVDQVLVNIEAQANNKGVRPYRVTPPAMTLPHPSAKDTWCSTRPTKQATRKHNNPSQSDSATGIEEEEEDPDERQGAQDSQDESSQVHSEPDMDTTLTLDKDRSTTNSGAAALDRMNFIQGISINNQTKDIKQPLAVINSATKSDAATASSGKAKDK